VHNDAYRAVAMMDDRRFIDRFAFAAPLVRLLRRRPHDSIGVVVAAIASGAIFVNALWLQTSAHPAPLFHVNWRPVSADTTGSVTPVLPRPRPAELEAPKADVAPTVRTRAQITSDIQRELARRKFYDGPVDGVYGAKTDAAIREFEHAAGLKASVEPDEALLRALVRSSVQAPAAPTNAANAKRGNAASATAPSKRVVAVQRALADFGYGQLAPTGVADPPTKSAIERFERERKLPITGQVSDRVVRELASITGRPLE
jgi:peptidoglycan hydrolase-like protein with peptidoglycan-binding domain